MPVPAGSTAWHQLVLSRQWSSSWIMHAYISNSRRPTYHGTSRQGYCTRRFSTRIEQLLPSRKNVDQHVTSALCARRYRWWSWHGVSPLLFSATAAAVTNARCRPFTSHHMLLFKMYPLYPSLSLSNITFFAYTVYIYIIYTYTFEYILLYIYISILYTHRIIYIYIYMVQEWCHRRSIGLVVVIF